MDPPNGMTEAGTPARETGPLQITASVPPGTHDFVIVFHDNDDPPDRKYTITTSGTFGAGEHRTMSVDTDGATWK